MGLLDKLSGNRDGEISRQAMEACESILSEIGAELHDDLIQKLSVLRLHLDKIERSSFDPEQTRDSVVRMQADFQDIVDSVRRISRRLHPVRMELDDFQSQVEQLRQNMEMPGAVRIHVSFTGDPQLLTALQERYLLRIIQELTANAFRHSSAWYVWIRIQWQSELLTIDVEDDGAGFAKRKEFIETLKQKHNTLRMRSQAINADLAYLEGEKGLLARLRLSLPPKNP